MIVLPTKETTTKLAQNKAEKESLTMRKQGYVIIGIGLATLAGVFWLSQLDSKEETPTTAAKPPSQETMDASPTEKLIDPFAGMRRQSTSEIDSLSEEDKKLMAEREDWEKSGKPIKTVRKETIWKPPKIFLNWKTGWTCLQN